MRVCGFSDCLYHACHCPDLNYMCLEGELAMNSDSQFSMQFFTSVTYVCVIKPSKIGTVSEILFFPFAISQKKSKFAAKITNLQMRHDKRLPDFQKRI